MSEKNIQKLESCGVDYREGLEKFMDEAELYEGLLVDFLTDHTRHEVRDRHAFDERALQAVL